jgi:hypothetical protein
VSILGKYRPKSLSEFLKSKDLDKVVEKLKKTINENETCILYGINGIGKTSLYEIIAKELGYSIVVYDSSIDRGRDFLDKIFLDLQMKPMMKILYVLEDADSMDWTQVRKGIQNKDVFVSIVKKTKNPLILVVNELNTVPKEIQRICITAKLNIPIITDVISLVNKIALKEKLKPSYGTFSVDVRKSLLKAFYGSEVYESIDIYTRVKQMFAKQIEPKTEEDMIWMLDNATNFFNGKNLVDFLLLLAKADIYGIEILKARPKSLSGSVNYPYFYRRLSLSKQKPYIQPRTQ